MLCDLGGIWTLDWRHVQNVCEGGPGFSGLMVVELVSVNKSSGLTGSCI